MANEIIDNKATVEIAGTTLELEASLGACTIYANEFHGKLGEPYTGNLVNDMLELFKATEQAGDSASLGDPELYRLIWAMGRACGSVKSSYKKFEDGLMHAAFNIYEWSEAYRAVVHGLGDGVFFRVPEGFDNPTEPDAQ